MPKNPLPSFFKPSHPIAIAFEIRYIDPNSNELIADDLPLVAPISLNSGRLAAESAELVDDLTPRFLKHLRRHIIALVNTPAALRVLVPSKDEMDGDDPT